MRFLKAVLPNITIALNLSLLVVCYLDMRNPMMGFLVGTPSYTLAALSCICSIVSSIVLFASWRKSGKPHADAKKERIDT